MAIRALDGRVAAAELGAGDGVEGHLAAVGRSDAKVLEIGERASRVGRVADHHPDVVAAALDALGLLAVESLTDLLREVVEGDPEGLGGGQDGELDLLLALRGRSR